MCSPLWEDRSTGEGAVMDREGKAVRRDECSIA